MLYALPVQRLLLARALLLPPPGDTDALSADDGKLDVWADEGGNHFCMVYYFGIINRYCLHKASCLKVRPMSV